MTVTYSGDGVWIGLSSDTKPDNTQAINGHRFYEQDTYDWHVFDGNYWWLRPNAFNPYSIRRWGILPWSASTTAGTGILSSLAPATGAGTPIFANDTTNGRYMNMITGTTTGNRGGYKSAISAGNTTRNWSWKMRYKFQIPASGDYTLARLYIGVISTGVSEATGDDPFNAASGYVVGFKSGSTAFTVFYNGGTGATNERTTGLGNLDTSIHTVSMIADSTQIAYKFDTNAYQVVTSSLPNPTASMHFHFLNETNESGVAKNFRLYSMYVQSDR